jgi:hypothetical protein
MIKNSLEWAAVRQDLWTKISGVPYSPDLRRMLKNADELVTELSKIEVDARRTKSNTKVLKSAKSTSTKVVHPDGTVFYRADRQKWVAVMNGKQEAARPTSDACLAFLKKKYNVVGVVLK